MSEKLSDKAERIILDILADGSKTSPEIETACGAAGIGKWTMVAAKKKLSQAGRIKSRKGVGAGASWITSLTGAEPVPEKQSGE